MTKLEKHDTLRDEVGQIISDMLADGIDIHSSHDIDLIADAVLVKVLDIAAAAVIERAAPSDEMFVVNAVDAIEGLKP